MVWDEKCGTDEVGAWACSVMDDEGQGAADFCEAPGGPFMTLAECGVDDAVLSSARGWAMGGVAGTVMSLPSRLDDAEDDGTASPLLVSEPICDMRSGRGLFK